MLSMPKSRSMFLSDINIINNMQTEKIDAKEVIKQIIEGIQDKKGKEIVVVDMLKLGNSICDYFVICQGNSPNQVSAITDSIEDTVRINCKRKPYSVDGLRNSQWVAMDYGDILVHIFLPDVRNIHNIPVDTGPFLQPKR